VPVIGPQNTFVLGDSAGGQITLSSVIYLRDNNSGQPSRLFLIAPVLGAAMDNPGIAAVEPLLPIPEGRAARRRIVDTINGTPPGWLRR
jgi:acetyl esterase/lipase